MARTCFIGNSHLAAFKQGLDRLIGEGAIDAASVATVGTPKNKLAYADIKDGKMIPTDERMTKDFQWTSGMTVVDLQQFDAFVIAAGLGPLSLYCYVADDDPSPFVSRALVRAVIKRIQRGWQHGLARRILEAVPTARILFVGQPPFAETDPAALAFLEALEEPGAMDAVRRLQGYIDDELDVLTEKRITFVRVPPDMLESKQVFLKQKYCRGSVRLLEGLDVERETSDTRHMNGEYGYLMARRIFSLLDEPFGGPKTKPVQSGRIAVTGSKKSPSARPEPRAGAKSPA